MLGNAAKRVTLIGFSLIFRNAGKKSQWVQLSEYKLYMGHIHTLVLTEEWIAIPIKPCITYLTPIATIYRTICLFFCGDCQGLD